MKIPVRLIATVALTILTLGFLVMVWKGRRHTRAKTPLEIASDSLEHYQQKARSTHDSSAYYDAKYQQSKARFDSVAAHVFDRSPTADRQRDSLRAVIQRGVLDSLRVRTTRQRGTIRGIEAHTPKP